MSASDKSTSAKSGYDRLPSCACPDLDALSSPATRTTTSRSCASACATTRRAKTSATRRTLMADHRLVYVVEDFGGSFVSEHRTLGAANRAAIREANASGEHARVFECLLVAVHKARKKAVKRGR